MPATTRGASRTFYNAACHLPYLDLEHHPFVELPIYDRFLHNILKAGAQQIPVISPVIMNKFLVSEKGAWYTRLVLFKNRQNRWNYYGDDGKVVWDFKAVTVETAIRDLRRFKKHFRNPISIVLGQMTNIGQKGHAVTLILFRTDNGNWDAILKDSLPAVYEDKNEKAKVTSHCIAICKSFGIRWIKLVPQLVHEEENTAIICIHEAYRVVGNVLDGRYPLEILPRTTKCFDVVDRKYL